MAFLDENYLLTNDTASRIFQEVRDLPILDPHNHADVREIRENENYPDLWVVEAATDHYVWELLRKRGVEEKFITGNAPNKEKWLKMAGVFEDLVGNPTYEWVHMDLKRRLGIELLINEKNAEEIWDKSTEILQQERMKPRALLEEMNVEVMCSTDDPLDILEDHRKLKDLNGFETKILPTWRPDKAMNIFKPEFPRYIEKLGKRTGKTIGSIEELISSLRETHDYFEQLGTVASDHGVEIPFGYKVKSERAEKVFQKRMNGSTLTEEEQADYISYMLHQFGEMNARSDWVMQIHIGAVRDVRQSLLESIGPDSGGDVSDHSIPIVEPLRNFLNAFDNKLKVVLYALDPSHLPTLVTLARAFGEKVSVGAAWWFNDSPIGMKRHLEYLASVDLLMNFGGMVSDSRKLLSYGSRTEMFRRVLADVLGDMVEKGQIPEELAFRSARYICYERKRDIFGF